MTFHILGIILPTDFHIFHRGWNHQLGIDTWTIHGSLGHTYGYRMRQLTPFTQLSMQSTPKSISKMFTHVGLAEIV